MKKNVERFIGYTLYNPYRMSLKYCKEHTLWIKNKNIASKTNSFEIILIGLCNYLFSIVPPFFLSFLLLAHFPLIYIWSWGGGDIINNLLERYFENTTSIYFYYYENNMYIWTSGCGSRRIRMLTAVCSSTTSPSTPR